MAETNDNDIFLNRNAGQATENLLVKYRRLIAEETDKGFVVTEIGIPTEHQQELHKLLSPELKEFEGIPVTTSNIPKLVVRPKKDKDDKK